MKDPRICIKMPLSEILTGKQTFVAKKPINLSDCTKSEILAYFENCYDLSESLFTSLRDDSVFYKCPDKLRLPLIFYFAHTATVYINKLMIADFIKKRVNFEYEAMFETGVDEMSWDDTENWRMGGEYKWPSVAEVVDYRRQVRRVIEQAINDMPLQLPITYDSPWWALMMGMEHELAHFETTSVLIRQLPIDCVKRPDGWMYANVTYGNGVKDNDFVETKKEVVKLGKPFNFPSYGWDNEYGKLFISVPSFKATKFLITNREFLEFLQDGGYTDNNYWTEEGWKWLKYRGCCHPLFWVCDRECKSGCGGDLVIYSHCKKAGNYLTNGYCNGHNSTTDGNEHQVEGGGHILFRYRAMFDVIDMPWDWPVEVNYHEAKAFCHWKGSDYRLPTEAEHHVMRGKQADPSRGTISDIIYQDKIKQNVNFQCGSSSPVNAHPPSSNGFYDVFGNVWEWVEDHFNGLPGYKPFYYYEDYSLPFFDGRHNLMMGGSWASMGDGASRFTRYAFRRHFFQHCGFRLVQALKMTKTPVRLVNTEVYILGVGVEDNKVCVRNPQISIPSANRHYYLEHEDELNDMMQLEYGSANSYPMQLADITARACEKNDIPTNRLLHLGCATGKATFQLANVFDEILGTDYCGRFIDVAIKLQKGEPVAFYHRINVEKVSEETTVPQIEENDRITFKQLTWIPNEIGFFDCVLLSNLDRIMEPKAWLVRLWEIMKPHAIVIIASERGMNHDILKPKGLSLIDNHKMYYEAGLSSHVADITIWKMMTDKGNHDITIQSGKG